MSTEGRYAEAEATSRATVDEATAAGLYSTASQGLTDFCHTLTVTRRYDEAAAVIGRAIDLAIKHEAKRSEMRAKMQRASLLYERSDLQSAIDQSVEPLKFFRENGFPRPEADGKNIIVRAYEQLERYGEGAQMSRELIALAESMGDESLLADSMEGLASRLVSQGRLPEALTYQETLEKIYRRQPNDTGLSFALNNRAEILIKLGRGQEGEPLLAELVSKAASGLQPFKARTRRTAVIRAMHATFERRWKDVGPQAQIAMTLPGSLKAPDLSWRWGSLLLEHAKAQQGKPGAPTSALTQWIADTTNPATRREIAYWVGQTLVARGDLRTAQAILGKVLAEPGAAASHQQLWRVAALAGVVEKSLVPSTGDSVSIRLAFRELQALKTAWTSHAAAYLYVPIWRLYRRNCSSARRPPWTQKPMFPEIANKWRGVAAGLATATVVAALGATVADPVVVPEDDNERPPIIVNNGSLEFEGDNGFLGLKDGEHGTAAGLSTNMSTGTRVHVFCN